MEQLQANAAQTNLAAKIAVQRGIDFNDALDMVLTNPAAAQGILNGSSGAGGGSTSDILAAIAAGQVMGKNSVLAQQEAEAQSARLAKLEENQGVIAQELGRVKAGAVLTSYGFADHLTQHAQVRAGQLGDIDALDTVSRMRQHAVELGLTDALEGIDAIAASLPEPRMKRVLEVDANAGKKGKRSPAAVAPEESES